MLSPDRRGGRLTGPALPATAQPHWTSTSTASRSGPPPSISCEPAGHSQRDGRQSPPPFTPQSMLAQQAYVALGQSTGEMPATARPQWRDPSGYQQSPLQVRNASASSAHSLQIPVGSSSSAGTCSLGSRGCSAVVPVPVKTTISDDNSATTRFTTPNSASSSVSISQPHRVTVECRRQTSTGPPIEQPTPDSQQDQQNHQRRWSSSLPSHSPLTAAREPKSNTIEVPLTAGPPRRREDEALSTSEVLEKRASEVQAVEDFKRIHDVQGEMSQDVKGVKTKLDTIESWLKDKGKAEAAVQNEEISRQLRKTEQQLQEEAAVHRQELERAQQALAQSKVQLEEQQKHASFRETELLERLQASEVALRERQDQLEQAQRAAMCSQQQLEEREEELLDLRRTAEETSTTAQDEARESAIADLERKLKESGEECNTFKVRFSSLQFQVDQQTGELQQRITEASRLQERLDLEAQERRALETRLSAANGQYQTLSMEHRSLQEQVEHKSKMHEQKLESLDLNVRLREQQLAELESDVASRQRALVTKEEGFAKTELAMQDQQLQREQLVLEQENLDKERQEIRDKHRKLIESDKENRSLKATVQEQKGMLFDLESQLHREQTISNFITPGEFIRLAKKQEGELYAHDNADLRLKNSGLETEVQQVRWHNEVMKKHLPRSAWAEVAKEVNSRPLPTSTSTKEASPPVQTQIRG